MRIGIDLGGTKTELIALDDKGGEIHRVRIPTEKESYRTLLAMLVRLVRDTEAQLGQKGTVGIGIPGTIAPRSGKVKNANTTVLNGHRLDEDLSKALQRPVRCMNDANCFAVSEAADGAGAGYGYVFGVIIGTGCGGGLVINGLPWAGANSVAGEWGHNPLPWMTEEEFPGPECWCGHKGCIETWISGTAFEKDYAGNADGLLLRADRIIKAARAGELKAMQALDRYTHRLARCLAHVVNIFDPEIIVLGGGMSNVDELYEKIPPLMNKYVFGGEAPIPVLKSRHGDSSGVRGAAWLWP
jgi:fructokinase